MLRNLSDISGLDTVALSIRQGLALIANDNIPVWSALVQRVLEELADKRCRERDDEGLVVLSGLLSQSHDSLRGDCEVVTADVDGLRILNQAPDLWSLQVLKLVVVGSCEVGAHAPVVTGDDDTATASWVIGIDTIFHAETSLFVCILQDFGVLVVTDAANVDDGVVWEHVLCATSSVLCCSAGNELRLEVVEEIIVEAKVLLIREDGVVLLQFILVQESLVAGSLDVWPNWD